jgi:hypothetical protein
LAAIATLVAVPLERGPPLAVRYAGAFRLGGPECGEIGQGGRGGVRIVVNNRVDEHGEWLGVGLPPILPELPPSLGLPTRRVKHAAMMVTRTRVTRGVNDATALRRAQPECRSTGGCDHAKCPQGNTFGRPDQPNDCSQHRQHNHR